MIKRRLTNCLTLAASLALSMVAFARDAPQVSVQEPRAFGYTVGDIVERRVTVFAPQPFELVLDSLPKAGRLGQAFELRESQLASRRIPDGTRYELRLTYQIFFAPAEVKTLDLPAFTLRLDSAARTEEARIDYWPITVTPLAPIEASPRRGLGAMRPDATPPTMDTHPTRVRLALYGGSIALLLLYLAYVYFGPPFVTGRRRPFARAYREIRGLMRDASPDEFRRACQRMHRAFDESAGHALFAGDLERFLAAEPRFAALKSDFAVFFERSRQAFFADDRRAATDVRWLVDFCRQCRDVERGTA